MQNTDVSVGFTSDTVIQLRLNLGAVVNGVQQPASAIPPHDFENEAGYIYQNGQILGRISGDRQYYMPLDQYLASPLDPLFDLADPFSNDANAPADDRSSWTVLVDGVAVPVTGLSRKANILDTAETGWFEFEFTTTQNVFLELDAPIPDGATIEIQFDDPAFDAITGVYDPETVISEAIHVNLVGYDPDDAVKVAYLSSWNGWSVETGGDVAQAYTAGTGFDVVDETTGQIALSGQIELYRAVTDPQNFWNNYQFTDVFSMDFSGLDQEGRYHVRVDGVGRSPTFEVSDTHWGDVFDVSFSGYYHLRSGIALEEEYTDWTRPRSFHPDDGFVIQETKLELIDTSEGPLDGTVDPFSSFAGLTTGEVLTDAWGGWHDAGDYDRRSQHLEAARKLLELVEIAPDFTAYRDASIPEMGDGIPDAMDEAMWTIDLFRRLQTADGGVRGGIESESFAVRGEGSWADSQNHYAYAPDAWSSYEFAAAAAKAAFLFQTYDPSRVAEWTDAAERAWDWAEANPKTLTDDIPAARMDTARTNAAAELFRLTDDEAYHDAFKADFAYTGGVSGVPWYAHQYEAAFTYARTDAAEAPLVALATQAIVDNAVFERDVGDRGGFGETINPYAPYGWSATSTHVKEAELYIRSHVLTGDDTWIAEVEADMQYPLGTNPLNMSYVTGLGSRQPEEILHNDMDVLGRDELPPGITLYGPYSIHDYGQQFYHDIMWQDVFPNFWRAPISESFQGFSVFVPSTEFTVQQGITDTTYAAGYLASHQPGLSPIEGTANSDDLDGDGADNLIRGLGGADMLKGLAGDDELFGGAGTDILNGGPGADLLDGGDGFNFADYRDVAAPLTPDLVTRTNSSTVFAEDAHVDIRRIYGSATHANQFFGDDARTFFIGGEAGDTMFGGGGSDILRGQTGGDSLFGGDGRDALIGNAGNDTLGGGADRDMFYFFGLNSGLDTLIDFSVGEDLLGFDGGVTRGDITFGTSGNGWAEVRFGSSVLELEGVAPGAATEASLYFYG